jgi:hypothetical protein
MDVESFATEIIFGTFSKTVRADHSLSALGLDFLKSMGIVQALTSAMRPHPLGYSLEWISLGPLYRYRSVHSNSDILAEFIASGQIPSGSSPRVFDKARSAIARMTGDIPIALNLPNTHSNQPITIALARIDWSAWSRSAVETSRFSPSG